MTPFAGTPRYFAWLYGGERLQGLLQALFGIEAEIRAALQPGLEHTVAHARMNWWSEEAQRLKQGQALHPLTRALYALRPSGPDAPPCDITGLVDVTAWDLACATFETGRELAGYCERWAQALPQLAARWAAPELPSALTVDFSRGVGVALCELEMLLSLQQAARAGRLRLPLDELATLGVAPETLAETPWPDALSARLRERHRQLRASLLTSCALLRTPAQRTPLRGLLVWAQLIQRHSRRAERALPGTWQRNRWNGIGDALSAWHTARGAVQT